MVILRKLKAATLVETLTASVIIVIVFMIASFSFNNVFNNSHRSDDVLIKNRIKEITYLSKHDKLDFPLYEEGTYWEISGTEVGGRILLEIENTRKNSNYQITITR